MIKEEMFYYKREDEVFAYDAEQDDTENLVSFEAAFNFKHAKKSDSDIYIAEYDAVDSKRRSLYTQMSDPLYFEAYRAKDDGDIAKYEDFKAQADAAVDKIKIENPWPVNPEV